MNSQTCEGIAASENCRSKASCWVDRCSSQWNANQMNECQCKTNDQTSNGSGFFRSGNAQNGHDEYEC